MKLFYILGRNIKFFLFDALLLIEFFYDFNHFRRNYARTGNRVKDLKNCEARIILYYHVLEKGLSHPQPKKLFGYEAAKTLADLLEDFVFHDLQKTNQIVTAIEVLSEYTSAQMIKPFIDKKFCKRVIALRQWCGNSNNNVAGAISLSKSQFFREVEKPFGEFARSRRSCRYFSDSKIPKTKVIEAVDIAKSSSPSVCNRQTCKVHYLTDKSDILNHLKLQEGNRGFSDNIQALLLVTSDLKLFVNLKERNQAFVDGGIFTMSLLLSLHSVRLGAVPLNWCYDSKQDRALRRLGFVSQSEKLIVMIGIGNVPDYFAVPGSMRRPISEILETY